MQIQLKSFYIPLMRLLAVLGNSHKHIKYISLKALPNNYTKCPSCQEKVHPHIQNTSQSSTFCALRNHIFTHPFQQGVD